MCEKEEATQAGQDAASTAVADKVTPEQQAAIDALDKPVLDEKNTDVVEGSASSETAASETHICCCFKNSLQMGIFEIL